MANTPTSTNTTYDLLTYYSNLLIRQYYQLPKATGMVQAFVRGFLQAQTSVQTISFSPAPASGNFTLSYNGNATTTLSSSSTAANIQSALQALSGLGSVTVTGTITTAFTVTFTGVVAPALPIVAASNTLQGTSAVLITISETDLTLPLAVLNGYNLLGDNPAVGVQLDILGKYAGVTRMGYGFKGQPITLNDADFLSLIRMAIITNNSDASLETIQNNLQAFFPGQITVTDYQDMRLGYFINSSVGSQNLIELFITEGLLPKPLGVQISIGIAPDVTNIYAFRTYSFVTGQGKPMNQYASFNESWVWLNYEDFI